MLKQAGSFGAGPQLPDYEPTSIEQTFVGSNSKHLQHLLNPPSCWTLYWFWDKKNHNLNTYLANQHPVYIIDLCLSEARVSCVDVSSCQRICALKPQDCREGVAIKHTVNHLGKEWRHITSTNFNSNSNVPLIIFDVWETHFVPDCKTYWQMLSRLASLCRQCTSKKKKKSATPSTYLRVGNIHWGYTVEESLGKM